MQTFWMLLSCMRGAQLGSQQFHILYIGAKDLNTSFDNDLQMLTL